MQLKISENKLLPYLIGSALVLFYVADGLNKYFQFGQYLNTENNENAFSISIYLRFVYEIIFAFIIIANINYTRRKVLLASFVMFTIFLVGHAIFNFNYSRSGYSLFYQFTLLNKYLFIFIIYGGIYKIVDNYKSFGLMIKIYEKTVVVNSVLIIAGLIFNINLLKSYYAQDYRYGYDGLIPAINEATLYYFIAISYYYYNYFVQKNKSWEIYLVIFSSLLLGTKTIYLFLVMLIIFHLITRTSVTKMLIYVSAILIVIPLVVIPIVLDPKYSFIYTGFVYFYEKEGFWYMITSGRSAYISTKFIDAISHWNVVNYIFGGTDQQQFIMEMDFFDLFLFSGAIGTLVLIYSYYKTVFKNDLKIMFLNFFSICYFLFAFLSGHMLTSAANALNLVLVVLFIANAKYRLADVETDYSINQTLSNIA